MLGEFAVGAVDGFTLLAREFDLTAGLERNWRALALERDDAPVLVFGFVAEAIAQPTEDFLDAIGAGEGQGATVARGDCNFFVLGADPPFFARLGAAFEIANQVLLLLQCFTHRLSVPHIGCMKGPSAVAAPPIMAALTRRGKPLNDRSPVSIRTSPILFALAIFIELLVAWASCAN